MIKVTISQAAQKRGIKNAYQLGQRMGIADKVAADLWGNPAELKLKTLNRICNALGCDLGELISYKPDKRGAANGHSSPAPRPRKQKSGTNVKPNAPRKASKQSR